MLLLQEVWRASSAVSMDLVARSVGFSLPGTNRHSVGSVKVGISPIRWFSNGLYRAAGDFIQFLLQELSVQKYLRSIFLVKALRI